MAAQLQNLIIENFRSIRGQIVVPLNAQIVLVHGTNGMGKTSVLSALELALTGSMAQLAGNGDNYKSFLTHLGKDSGSIQLTTDGPFGNSGQTEGVLRFSDNSFEPEPLLNGIDARFFTDRCYLPQAALGRLLEIYDQQKPNTASPLTQFVKELLRLDGLDGIIDGLNAAYHAARVRNVVPNYRHLETFKTSLEGQISRNYQAIAASRESANSRKVRLVAVLAELLAGSVPPIDTVDQVQAVRQSLQMNTEATNSLADAERARAELRATVATWRSLPRNEATQDYASHEHASVVAAAGLTAWREAAGSRLLALLDQIRTFFPDIPGMDDGPSAARAAAENRVSGELSRCQTLIQTSESAGIALTTVQQTIQRANARIGELDAALSISAQSTEALASSLAAISSHVHSDNCPVCDRNFAEEKKGPLSAHIANKIAALTTQAGRLQALATERAQETNRLTAAQRQLLSVQQTQLPELELVELRGRASQMSKFLDELGALVGEAAQGNQLMSTAAVARERALAARRSAELMSSILPEIDRIVLQITGVPVASFESTDQGLQAADLALGQKIDAEKLRVAMRVEAVSLLELYNKDLTDIQRVLIENASPLKRLELVESAFTNISDVRHISKTLADAALELRSNIVTEVFSTSLNKTWRDLFVRLAPSEDFVPIFKLPAKGTKNVEAVLETEHRSGKPAGTPGAMLSQGNLNTAALTLFLALHLSVPSKMPWLILDDPVQSMDDVHIAQFSALLRSLSKGMQRQLIVAVHERSLFEYLTLELSPAFPGDSLITVELSKNFEGSTVAKPIYYNYEDDRVIAA